MSKKNKTEVEIRKSSNKEMRTAKAKQKSFIRGCVLTAIVGIVCLISLVPLLQNIKFGLDLQGGFEILYKVESIDGSKANSDIMQNTYRTILKRVDILGVSEPEISIEGDNIRIQLAGVTDEKEAKTVLSSMANLTFRDSKDNLVMSSKVLKGNSVRVAQDQNNLGNYYLTLEISDVDTFHRVTEQIRATGEPMVIWLDFDEKLDSFEKEVENCGTSSNSRCISYAYIQQELTTSTVTLTGNFTQNEAKALADLINSGSLPTKLTELSARTVNASFGNDALDKTFVAGLAGIILIVLTMTIIYRISGFVTSVAIIIYTTVVFAIFNMIGGRLTLPGIAATVIGIGMAIDAAVISFARIKEELREKYSLEEAFKRGNKFSFTSILDANVSSLLVAIILFVLGESSVKGFATMLIIGIIASMAIMVYFLRFLLGMFVRSGWFDNKYKAFVGIKDLDKKNFLEKFDYGKHMRKITIVTTIILIIGIGIFTQRGFNLGIDFKGGSSISLIADDSISGEQIKSDLEELGYRVEKYENIDKNSVYLTVAEVFVAEDNDRITSHFEEKYEGATTNIGAVSNKVKQQLVENAIKALIYATVGLIIYVTIRFTFSFSIGTIAGVVHDVIVVGIFFSIFGFEVTSIFIAAVLSIIGYSINDTIVVFDRVRENKKKLYDNKIKNKEELRELISISIKETVMRNLITALTTLFAVGALLVFGAHEINNFNYALLIGFIAGAYSSLFITAEVYYLLESRRIGKPEKKKWWEEELNEKEELKIKGINC